MRAERLLLACVLAVSAACGSESEPGSGAGEVTAEAGRPAAAPAPPAADDAIVPRRPPEPPPPEAEEMTWLLSLDLDGAEETEVLAGTPLLFSVSLTGAGAGPPGRLGGAERPWHSQLALEPAEHAEPAAWQALALAPRTLVFGPDAPRDEDAPLAVVAPDRVHLLTLAVPPEQAVRIAPGRYTVRAVVRRPDRSGEAARVVSQPVTIVVRERADDPATQAAFERHRELAEAGFDLGTERFEAARQLAARLVAREPTNLAALVLAGDAAVGLHRDEEARAAYLAAFELALAKGQLVEPPDILMDRLAEVERRLAPPEPAPEAASERP